MKEKLLILTFSLLIPSTLLAGTEEDIKQYCSNKWGTNYKMVKYCQDNLFEDWEKVKNDKYEYYNFPEKTEIINNCWEQWYPNMSMINYCTKGQIKAYESLQR